MGDAGSLPSCGAPTEHMYPHARAKPTHFPQQSDCTALGPGTMDDPATLARSFFPAGDPASERLQLRPFSCGEWTAEPPLCACDRVGQPTHRQPFNLIRLGHVVPPENLACLTISAGPSGLPLGNEDPQTAHSLSCEQRTLASASINGRRWPGRLPNGRAGLVEHDGRARQGALQCLFCRPWRGASLARAISTFDAALPSRGGPCRFAVAFLSLPSC